MRFSRGRSQESNFEVVITSMLDINFLLIMFFMMTSQFQRESRADLKLPQEAGEQQDQPDESALIVNMTKNGEIIVFNETVDPPKLRQLLEDQKAKQSSGDEYLKVMIRADREADTSHLNRMVTMLRESGVGGIRIATEVPK